VDDHDAVADLSRAAFDRRLDRSAASPIVVAFSGGGDSLALLIGARRWARDAGRRLLAVTIDHRLQPGSAGWALWCAERAQRLGVAHRILAWDGEKPRLGIPAAARAARHALLAGTARAAGARVILFGHTADDRLEARVMRQGGGSVPEPREWTPSPVWPEGRGLFALRPLLGVRRADIRARLAEAGETWLDDPANADPRHPRVRARLHLAGGGDPLPEAAATAPCLDHLTIDAAGEIALGARACRPPFLGPALLCASGSDRPPRRGRLDRLLARIEAAEPFTATLAGARVESDGAVLKITRESGDIARAGGGAHALLAGEPIVWDGRFEVAANVGGLTIAPLAGHAARLDRSQRAALSRLSRATRKGLPVIIDGEGRVSAPLLAQDARVRVRSLVANRFLAACGAITNEADAQVRSGNATDTLNRLSIPTRRVHEPA
jgi:tRNA(Ile)-lysidine synthase